MKNLLLILSAMTGFLILEGCDNNDLSNPASDKYFSDVKTILQNSCTSCHSSEGTWEGRPIAFDTDTLIAQQYIAIKAAVADPVSVNNKRMPKDGALTAKEIDIIVKWFEKGGKVTD